MRTITVNIRDLLIEVENNHDRHVDVYKRAMVGYSRAAHQWLSETLNAFEMGEHPSMTFREPMPVDHSDDYERTLAMLRMAVGETIEIDEREFAQYVMDDWGWKREWAVTNAAYLVE